jgi:hypothetical protein
MHLYDTCGLPHARIGADAAAGLASGRHYRTIVSAVRPVLVGFNQ